jgi:hypothetical protein
MNASRMKSASTLHRADSLEPWKNARIFVVPGVLRYLAARLYEGEDAGKLGQVVPPLPRTDGSRTPLGLSGESLTWTNGSSTLREATAFRRRSSHNFDRVFELRLACMV